MRLKIISLFLFNWISFQLFAQVNLVANPSFEAHSGCPSGTTQWYLCSNWSNCGGGGTPDFYHTCGTTNVNVYQNPVPPSCGMGFCNPHTGGGMMGLINYDTPYPNYREYLSTQLSCPITAGNVYTVSFWVNVGTNPYYNFYINNLGVYFSALQPSQVGFNPIAVVPQYEVTSVINTPSWVQYTFTLSPAGTYSYITIGNFRTDAQTNIVNFSSSFWPYANWFIDDVEVWAGNTTIPVTINTTSATCNFANGGATVTPLSGSYNYTWLPGNQNTSAVSGLGPGTYTVLMSNACYSDTKTLTIPNVDSLPITIVPSSTIFCTGGSQTSVTLTANGAASFTWEPGTFLTSSVAVSPTATTIYTVVGTNTLGCIGLKTIKINVGATPTLVTSQSSPTVCSLSQVSFSVSGAASYTWLPGNTTNSILTVNPLASANYTVLGVSGICSNSQLVTVTVSPLPTLTVSSVPISLCVAGSPPATLSAIGANTFTWLPSSVVNSSISVTPTATTIYTVSGTNAFGCSSSETVNLIVNPNPTVITSSTSFTICNGSSLTVNSFGALNYTWSPMSLNGNSINVNPSVNTTYSVTGINSFGCLATAIFSVTVNPTPSVSALSTSTAICNGASNTLTANGALIYTWSPLPLIGQTISVTPTVTTTYTVTGSNSFGCNNSQTLQLVVNPIPNLGIASDPSTVICIGNNVSLNAQGAQSYTWSPGTMTTNIISVSPTVSTIYTVTGNNSTGCSGSRTISIMVNQVPTLSASVVSGTVCKGNAAVLTASGAISYTWSPGAINGPTISVQGNSTTVYSVVGSNSLGCTGITTVQLVVKPDPTISIVASSTNICSGSSSTLTSGGALTYTWDPIVASGNNLVVTPSITTLYTVIGSNSLGCLSSKIITINVTATPSVSAASSESVLCNSGNISLFANGASTYVWLPGNQTGSVAIVDHTVTTTYTVIGKNGSCSDTASVKVILMNCNNSIFGLTKAASTPLPMNDDIYKITFTVTAVNVSADNLTNVTLNENLDRTFPSPLSYSVYSAPVITSHGSSLTINPLFDGGSNISLTSPGSSILLTNKRDTIVFTLLVNSKGNIGPYKNWVIGTANGFNNILLTDSSNNGFIWDENGNDDPSDDNSPTIIEFPVNELFIPEVITPNGDNRNDLFVIKGLNERKIKLSVFNRWGSKVYEKSEYDNTWAGYPNVNSITIGNGKLPQATYYYIIEFLDGNKEVKTGFVVLQY